MVLHADENNQLEITLAHWRKVCAQIAMAAQDCGRQPQNVKLVCVSKTFSADRVQPLIDAGQRIFGENRVQEAAGKWPRLRENVANIELHLIGPLQSNKAREAVELFDVIETLDRPKIAKAIADAMSATQKTPRLLIQVNTGAETQKAGVLPADLDGFVRYCMKDCGLHISGLMCIPPIGEPASPHFAMLAQRAARLGLPELSMGMSADFALAIQLGATYVRVGSAIFGGRS